MRRTDRDAVDLQQGNVYHGTKLFREVRMRVVLTLALLGMVGCASVNVEGWRQSSDAASFASAKPVWLDGREKEKNLFVGFRATVDGRDAERAVVRLTGSTICRLFVNGEFLGYGPARGPHGFYRVDEWPLKGRVQPGPNVIAIEVAGYNVNSFYFLDQPSFLQAEVVAGRKVLASTAGAGAPFEAQALSSRVQKVQRYSFQRPFSEVYRLTPDADAWRTDGAFDAQPLAAQPAVPLLPRRAPYPAFDVRAPAREVFAGEAKLNAAKKVWADRTIKAIGPKLGGFPEAELATIPFYEVQRLETASRSRTDRALVDGSPLALTSGQFRILDFGRNNSGFFGATLRCSAPCRVYFVFDEILDKEDVSVTRLSCCNVVAYDLAAAGTYRVETFEPYTLRYLKIMAAGAGCEVSDVHLRDYLNSATGRATFASSDPALNRIFEAARETFKQNAVDVFTDCPSRERAGWLCDSFFIGRVARDLCGDTRMERMFFENFQLPPQFQFLPDGMLPMCYPSDHNDGVYIPNWAMWFVIQLDEYLKRSGDRATVDALKPRVLALLDFFKTYKNSDGLLEKLPSWVFVEWSQANKLVQDVNYPSNMTYAEVLACAARLYDLPELQAEADQMRATIRRQSFDGTFFVDNAKRQPDGTLKPSGERTETCQYYAFFFGTATPQTHPALWEMLRADFGPGRRLNNKHPEIHFANAFIGNYLRLELLSRAGLSSQILDETKGYFLKMADLTETLWENDTPTASCCHGFASHVERLMYRDVLGIREIDAVNKKVAIGFSAVPLSSCSGTMPVGKGEVTLSWSKTDSGFTYNYTVPKGYTVTVDTSKLPLKAVRE
jgi:alpha-L-rhamnosidase